MPAAARFLALLLLPSAGLLSAGAAEPSAASPEFFEAHIAPLLTQHCLECHDTATKKGKLDLSSRAAAFAGGKEGPALVPHKLGESPLWKSVESDEMPDDRPPLSAEEKRLLRQWIEAGAVWPGNEIDLAAHPRGGRAVQSFARRLTVPEYVETVRSATGVDIAAEAARTLPPDVRADGFSNTAYNLNTDLAHVEAYARLARSIVNRMDTVKFAARFSPATTLDEPAMRALINGMGRWLLRGPLEPAEMDAFLRIPAAIAADGGDFAETAALLIEAMLQSPRFIYRIEKQRGAGGVQPVGAYELAARLSYLLWGGPPDEEMLRAAASGELSATDKIAAQVARMMQDPRVITRSEQFVSEWLNLDRLANLNPDNKRFPQWNAGLAADMKAETLAFFREIAWEQKRPLADLLNAQVTFASPRLAAHYGLPDSAAAAAGAVRRREGLVALYLFEETGGDLIRDASGAGEPLDLKIADAAAVNRSRGRLEITQPTLIAAESPPRRLVAAIRKSQSLTLEAWVTPRDDKQKGPVRILTLSSGSSARNFTIGQEADKIEVRLRAGDRLPNGSPGLMSPAKVVAPRPLHIVFTRGPDGLARLYLNGGEAGTHQFPGPLQTWDDRFTLALGNEPTRDRAWLGTLHRIAIYDRVLTPEEIRAPAAGMTRYDLTGVPSRGGLLTQGSLLTVGGDEASMVARGLFVLKDLLHSRVGSAPPGTDTTPVPTKRGQSQRTVSDIRLKASACSGCHAKFEPLAFALEKFDGIGAWSPRDRHGNDLREDGVFHFPGEPQPVTFQSSADFMDLLARSARVQKGITRKALQFALGRPLTGADTAALDAIHDTAQKSGGTYPALLTAIATSELLRTTVTESTAP